MVARVEAISTNSGRFCAIRMSSDIWNTLFINVYMPHTENVCIDLSVGQLDTLQAKTQTVTLFLAYRLRNVFF